MILICLNVSFIFRNPKDVLYWARDQRHRSPACQYKVISFFRLSFATYPNKVLGITP